MAEDFEKQARRAKFELVMASMAGDGDYVDFIAAVREREAERRPEGLALLSDFLDGGDIEEFRSRFDRWTRKPGRTSFTAFGGFSGQMFLNQMAKVSSDDGAANLLRKALAVPISEESAAEAIDDTVAFCERIKQGGHPAPGHAPFMVSFFWGLAELDDWPIAWVSAVKCFTRVGWFVPSGVHGADYLRFRQIVLSLGSADDVLRACSWWEGHPFVGLDPALTERLNLAVAADLRRTPEGTYASDEDADLVAAQARTVLGELSLLGVATEQSIADAIARTVKAESPAIMWSPGRFRADGWVKWTVDRIPGKPSLRVWATRDGLCAGLHPGQRDAGWYERSADALYGNVPIGLAMYPVQYADASRISRTAEQSPKGEFIIGRWYEDALGVTTFSDDLVQLARQLRPVFDTLDVLAGGGTQHQVNDDLDPLVEEFMENWGYPTEQDATFRARREQLAELLTHDALPVADVTQVRQIWNSNVYGGPGPQSVLNATIRDADPLRQEKILRNFDYLLWGEDSRETRINRLLDQEDLGMPGLGESVIVKLLSIAHPERWIPIFPYSGESGKRRHLLLLGLTPPNPTLSRGEIQVAANDMIRDRLDHHFPNDPWGLSRFVYWLGHRSTNPIDDADSLGEVAGELLVEKSDLEELVHLLEDKGQIILYGPPGTGKTYLARRLGAALAGDPERSVIVQFHPSMSYEDFFEGYRPRLTADGSLSYELRPGPLALMADQASASPSVRHVMVIDEINRANLPKVLGELLFLLEYRDEQVRTTYRPDEPFSLPRNLWFIGTMNTADRSISLIDAALRRRFHFVPFFPDDGMMAGLLERWLMKHQPDALWIAGVIAGVNAELTLDLGGPHLQVGPSHFMKDGIDRVMLESIWRYNVMPYIEDQLFGEPGKIAKYRLGPVLERFRVAGEELASAAGAEEIQ